MMVTLMNPLRAAAVLMLFLVGCAAQPGTLPARYYRLMEAGLPAVETRLAAEPSANPGALETHPLPTELPYPILAAAVLYTFFLDRQGHLSIFHEKLGLIVSGANSKRQPELATFSETVKGQLNHLPISSTLRMEESV